MDIKGFLGRKFIRCYKSEKDGEGLLIFEDEDGELFEVRSCGLNSMQVDWIDGFDDSDFCEISLSD